jgi:hypothetical protein
VASRFPDGQLGCFDLAYGSPQLLELLIGSLLLLSTPPRMPQPCLRRRPQVEDDPCFAHAADVRAAACTALAFLACHPLGARGDACLIGPFRQRLMGAGAFGALLRAALGSCAGDHVDPIIQQTAAVGIMYLSTMVGSGGPAGPAH